MSHFYVMAIVPDDGDPEARIEALMERYNENRETPEREEQCYCVGRLARAAAEVEATHRVGSIDSLRESFAKAHPLPAGRRDLWELSPDEEEERRIAWAAHRARWEAVEAETLAAHPLRNSADATCGECGGSGKSTTTYNPDSKWDWYVVGGRWDGTIRNERRTDGRGNYGEEHHNLRHNSLLPAQAIEKLTPDTYPFAVLTPDGEWHGHGRMGWFGMSSDELPLNEWRAKVRAILGDFHEGHIVVGLDCHI